MVLLPQPIFSPNLYSSFSSVREGKVWYSVRIRQGLVLRTDTQTVSLVSLASGRRRGTIQALSAARGDLNFLPHGIRLIKNQTVVLLPHPTVTQKC